MTAQDDNYILAHPPNLEFIQGHLKEPANNEQIREQLLFWKHWVFSDSVIRKPLHLIIYTLGFIYFLYMIIVGVRAIVQLSSIIGSLRISGILDILAILGLFIFIVIGVIIMSCMCIICAFFFIIC